MGFNLNDVALGSALNGLKCRSSGAVDAGDWYVVKALIDIGATIKVLHVPNGR